MAPIRSLLVHADGTRHIEARLRLARLIAAQHEAEVRVQFSVLPVPAELAHQHLQRAKSHVDHLGAEPGPPLHWCTPTDEPPTPAFTRLALHADLLVLGQRELNDVEQSNVPSDFVESVVLASGTPALVVPHHDKPAFEALDVALLAWQPSREAARALAAALPLLQRARDVHVATWMPDPQEAAREAEAVHRHLRLHGIEPACCHVGEVPPDAGHALLALAGQLEADFLVMGCYGHSRARELVLGGATRRVLKDMHLPVLLAH